LHETLMDNNMFFTLVLQYYNINRIINYNIMLLKCWVKTNTIHFSPCLVKPVLPTGKNNINNNSKLLSFLSTIPYVGYHKGALWLKIIANVFIKIEQYIIKACKYHSAFKRQPNSRVKPAIISFQVLHKIAVKLYLY